MCLHLVHCNIGANGNRSRVNHTGVVLLPTLIRQRRDHLFYGDCRSRAAQNAIPPFFENSLKCVCFCLITTLFNYHCTKILCEVEEQVTCTLGVHKLSCNSDELTALTWFATANACRLQRQIYRRDMLSVVDLQKSLFKNQFLLDGCSD